MINIITGLFNLNKILKYIIYGKSIYDYFITILIFIILLTCLKIFKTVILFKLKKLAKKTKNTVDDLIIDVLSKIGWPFYVYISFYFSILYLNLPYYWMKIINETTTVIITLYAILAVHHIINYYIEKQIKRKENKKSVSTVKLFGVLAKITLWSLALILILDNLGYKVSTLITGLGISGIAVAFALQNILTDIFASFSIYFDKPFEEGDYITIGDESGTVKKIGIKSTRIETLKGDELVISNKELTESKIHNYKKMYRRRINFNIGVDYNTPIESLQKIPKIITNIIEKIDKATPAMVHFNSFGDFALIYSIVYYIEDSSYILYMDIQQKINLEILKAFKKENISIAYPTQTIYLKKSNIT